MDFMTANCTRLCVAPVTRDTRKGSEMRDLAQECWEPHKSVLGKNGPRFISALV